MHVLKASSYEYQQKRVALNALNRWLFWQQQMTLPYKHDQQSNLQSNTETKECHHHLHTVSLHMTTGYFTTSDTDVLNSG